MEDYKNKKFSIIRHRGTPNKGQLLDKRWVYAQKKIWSDQFQRFVPTAPYSDHFIFTLPDDVKGTVWMCSCGSPAVITGKDGYVLDATAQGLMMLCMVHSSTGKHATGGDRWI